jgi:hypothetical protein
MEKCNGSIDAEIWRIWDPGQLWPPGSPLSAWDNEAGKCKLGRTGRSDVTQFFLSFGGAPQPAN